MPNQTRAERNARAGGARGPCERWHWNARDETFDLRRFVADEPSNWIAPRSARSGASSIDGGRAALKWTASARARERAAVTAARAAIETLVARAAQSCKVLVSLVFETERRSGVWNEPSLAATFEELRARRRRIKPSEEQLACIG